MLGWFKDLFRPRVVLTPGRVVRVDVTLDDIRMGDMSISNCMVARAMKREFPGRLVMVGITSAKVDNVFIKMPSFVGKMIEAFLNGDTIDPFYFSVRV